MLRDLLRFYREAPALLELSGSGTDLGEYLAAQRLRRRLPRRAPGADGLRAVVIARRGDPGVSRRSTWCGSWPTTTCCSSRGRPPWRVVTGGSASYVRALRARWNVDERLGCPVRAVRRGRAAAVQVAEPRRHRAVRPGGARLPQRPGAGAAERCERAPSATSSGAIAYQANETVLHTDAALLPREPQGLGGLERATSRAPRRGTAR